MGEKRGEHFEEETNPEEQNPEYNFELMKEIEPAMVSLVAQMKQDIEEGRWSSLLSDDAGGRIPTLVLRKILKEKGPNREVEARFLAAGQSYMPGWEFPDDEHDLPTHISKREDYNEAKSYLAGLNFGDRRVLIVTEYAFKGKTLEKMGLAMRDARVNNQVDFAVLHTSGFRDVIDRLNARDSKIFIGEDNYCSHFAEAHKQLSGVRKAKEYSPIPVTTLKKTKKEGREFTDEEFNQIFGIAREDNTAEVARKLKNPDKTEEYERRKKEPLTAEEEREIQRKVNLAREDVDRMAKRVIEQVWK